MGEWLNPIKVFGDAVLEAAEAHPDVVALSTDSYRGSGLLPFQERFPDRFFEFGIMEQCAIGFAAGLATTGKIPIIAAIASFITARPFEMLRNDLGYMRQNVKVVGRCAGFTYSRLGPTHYSLDDLAIMSSIPGMVVLSPGDPMEIRGAVLAAIRYTGPVYIRIGRPKIPVLFDQDHEIEIGKAVWMSEGEDVTLIATGSMLYQAYEAVQELKREGIRAGLVNVHTVKPFDKDLILELAGETAHIVTVEEHYLRGGLGSVVAETLAGERHVPVRMIGVADQYVTTGAYEGLLELHGLQAAQLVETVKRFIHKGG